MTPKSVSFTGLVVDDVPALRVGRKLRSGPIPHTWARLRFETDQSPQPALDRWTQENIVGRWACHVHRTRGKYVVKMAFESDSDAVMFRLKDGQKAWASKVDVTF